MFRRLNSEVQGFEDGFEGTWLNFKIAPGRTLRWWSHLTKDLWADAYLSDGTHSWSIRASSDLVFNWRRPQRCKVHLSQIVLNSGFPFGFFQVHVAMTYHVEAFVFPAAISVRDQPGSMLNQGYTSLLLDEFNLLESYREGDDVRRIHWKKSTLTDIPVVRKNRGERRMETGTLFIPDPTSEFENALRVLVGHLMAQKGKIWSTLLDSGEVFQFPSQLEFLRTLATIRPLSYRPDPDVHETPLYASDLAQLAPSRRRQQADPANIS